MKMKMKKLISLTFGVMLSVALLTGCGGDTSTPTTSTQTPTQTQTDTSTADAPDETASTGDAVQSIIDSGVLKVGVKNNVVGFGFQDILTNQYEGMEIDIAQLIADDLGIDIEFTTVTAATRTELLDSGDLDCVIATFTITDERKQSWSFTTPYYTDVVTALVENSSGITSLEGILGTTVGVSSGSSSARAMVAAMIEKGLLDGANFDTATFDAATWTDQVSFRQYDDYPAISTALAAGEISTFCVDKSILSYYNSDSRSFIEDTFAPQEYGVATSLNTEFAVYCEDLITTWLADGTIAALMDEHGV